MANDETMYKNVENENVQENKKKKSTVSDNLKMAGAAVAGAAVGSAATVAAHTAINNHPNSEEEVTAGVEGAEGSEDEVEVAAAEAPVEPQVVEHTTEVHHHHNTEVHHHHHAAAPQQTTAAPLQTTTAPQHTEEQIAQKPEDPNDPNVQQTGDNGGEDVDIHVIGVEHDVDMNGEQVDVAVINVEGHQGLLIDVDQEGTADVAVIDVDDSGTISENEVQDISDYDVPMPEQTSGDEFMQASDDMPDYINDAVLV